MKRTILIYACLLLIASLCKAQEWIRVTDIPKTDVFCLEQHNNTLYAGTRDKIYMSPDNGATWTASASLGSVGLVETITVFNNKIFVGTHSGGVLSSNNNGATWSPVNNGLGLLAVTKFAIWKDHLFAGTEGVGFYTFNETTNQWAAFNNNYSTNVDGIIWDIIATDSTLNAAAGANGFFHQFNSHTGEWDISNYLSRPSPGMIVYHLLQDSALILAGSTNATVVYRSVDGGFHWLPDAVGILNRGTGVFAEDKDNHYVSVSSFENNVNLVRLFRRNRNAALNTPWDMIDNFDNTFIYAMATAGGRLYTARDSGLYYKGNPPIVVPGVTPVITPGIAIGDISLYPNPASDHVTVLFNPSSNQEISIRVVDMLGRVVALPFEHYSVAPGSQTLSFNVSKLSAALYYVDILSGGNRHTIPLMVHH